MTNRISKSLSRQALAGLADAINNRPAMNAVVAKFTAQTAEEDLRRKRIVLLKLTVPAEMSFWQLLHNSPDKFQLISEKESHQKNEYYVRVIFYELGESLPVVKTQEELLHEYVHTPSAIEAEHFDE